MPPPSAPLRDRLSTSTAALVVVLLTVLTWVVILTQAQWSPSGDQYFIGSDLYSYFFPKFVYGSEEVLAGRLPLWNPYEFAGVPLLAAMQPAALYPPKILAFGLLEPGLGLKVFLFGHYLLAALGFMWFVRARGLSPLAAMTGALAFVLGPSFLQSNYHPVRAGCLAWLPLMFLCSDVLTRRMSARVIAALALVVALQLVAGYPEATLISGLLIMVHVLAARAIDPGDVPVWKSAVAVGLAFAVGALAAGLQIAPALEIIDNAHRPVLPELPPDPLAWLFLYRPYPLLVPFAFAGLMQLAGSPRARRACLQPLALMVALPALEHWATREWVPIFSATRHSITWLFISFFATAWLAACGVDSFARQGSPQRVHGAVRRLVGVFGLAWALLLALRAMQPAASIEPTALTMLGPAGVWSVATGLGIAGGILLVMATLVLRHNSPVLMMVAVATLATGHLAAFPYGGSAAGLDPPRHALRAYPAVHRLAESSGRILTTHGLASGVPLLERVHYVSGMEGSFPPRRFQELDRRLGLNAVQGGMDWSVVASAPGLLDTLDVDLVLAPADWGQRLRRAGLVGTASGDRVLSTYRNQDGLGRAWITYGVDVVDAPEEGLDRVLAPHFDPRLQAVLEEPPVHDYPALGAWPADRARVVYDSPTDVRVDAVAVDHGMLVLADACYPGWLATVDDEPAKIVCANGLVRAVELTPGAHVVRFRYRPRSITLGAAASVVGLLIIGALLLIPRRSWA